MQRKHHSAEFKAKVALEALKGDKTINEIAGANQVHPNQVSNWKKEAQAGLVELFSAKRGRKARAEESDKEALYSQIGRLKVELDWLKKSPGYPCRRTSGLAASPRRGDVNAAMRISRHRQESVLLSGVSGQRLDGSDHAPDRYDLYRLSVLRFPAGDGGA